MSEPKPLWIIEPRLPADDWDLIIGEIRRIYDEGGFGQIIINFKNFRVDIVDTHLTKAGSRKRKAEEK